MEITSRIQAASPLVGALDDRTEEKSKV